MDSVWVDSVRGWRFWMLMLILPLFAIAAIDYLLAKRAMRKATLGESQEVSVQQQTNAVTTASAVKNNIGVSDAASAEKEKENNININNNL